MSHPPGHEPIHNPHDKLFKHVFCRPANAAALIRARLPADVVDDLDMATIRAEPASSVDARLREHHSDLVFSIGQICDRERLYVVLEHKSAPEPFAVYTVKQYSSGITDRQVRQRRSAPGLPMVVSMIIHHGPRGWNAPRALHDLYLGTARVRAGLHRYLQGNEFLLYDVALESDERLREQGMNALSTLALWVLANARGSADIAADLHRVVDLFQRVLEQPGGTGDTVMFLRYILDVTDVALDALDMFIERAFGHRAQEVSMITTGERLRQEGRQRQLLLQLTHRFGVLPEETIQRVNTADTEALDTWALRLLDAGKLDEVFAAPGTHSP